MSEGRKAQVGEEGQPRVAGEAPKGGAPEGPVGGRAWLFVFSLVILPGLLYAAVLGVPFLPLGTGAKVWVSAGLILAAEGTFVVSALLLGREVVSRYRRYLDPRRLFRAR